MISRRNWMMTTAALAAAPQSSTAQGGGPKNVVISSANGLRACARAMQLLRAGRDTLDAVIAGVNIQEDDPEDNSVGYGGLPNEEGVVELDASVMHGPTRRCGSVAGIQKIKNPSKVAKVVMEQTSHVMLIGEGALRFAKAYGFKEEDLLTEKSRLAWMVWKQSMRDKAGRTNWSSPDAPSKAALNRFQKLFPAADEEMLAWALQVAERPLTGTISCLALNTKGEMSGVTTTSGLAWKIPGRVGDSPVIGAGLYVDQEIGGAGSTGLGEENIKVSGAHTIVENMRHGMNPSDACMDTLKRIAHNHREDRTRLGLFDITFYALRKDGTYGSASLWGGKQNTEFAVNNGDVPDSRLEETSYLLAR